MSRILSQLDTLHKSTKILIRFLAHFLVQPPAYAMNITCDKIENINVTLNYCKKNSQKDLRVFFTIIKCNIDVFNIITSNIHCINSKYHKR